jgi:hypothetical protein
VLAQKSKTGVLDAKKLSVKMGNKGPSGSLAVVMNFNSVTTAPGGANPNKIVTQMTFTTGNATISAKGTKGSGLEGKSYSGTGAALSLDGGTGTLVGIGGSMKVKTPGGAGQPAGTRDTMTFMTMVLQIAK